MPNDTTTQEGVVFRVNDTGLKLDGAPSWVNFSKLNAVTRPAEGDHVRLTLAPYKDTFFINECQIIKRNDAPVQPDGYQSDTAAPQTAPGVPPVREVMIAREAALKSAVEYAKYLEAHDSNVIAEIADSWARWIITGVVPRDQDEPF